MAGFSLRSAMQTDEAFLWRMVREAVNWLPERSLTLPEIEADPDLAHYVHGWMTSTDLGVVAVGDDGPIGAAWLRYFAAADPGFGYVDDATPEVSIAVVRSHRGRGVGRALLRAVMDGASARGVPAISLSVERANPARRLYLSEGFSVVAAAGGSDTMLATVKETQHLTIKDG